MTSETPEKKYPNLSEFFEMQKAAPRRNFYAIICEALGTDLDAYKRLTEEIILDTSKKSKREPELSRVLAIDFILRRLDGIVMDMELRKDEKRMAAADKGMNVWYRLLRELNKPPSIPPTSGVIRQSRDEVKEVYKQPKDRE